MNGDIVYEIIKELYLSGNALLVRKILFSVKSFSEIKIEKIDKPIILEIFCKEISFGTKLEGRVTIYWGDSNVDTKSSHKYRNKKAKLRTVRIFGHKDKFIMSAAIKNVVSIGDMTDLSSMFRHYQSIPSISKNWDTSEVICMTNMFNACYKLDKNIGKRWNTSKVTDMSCMFSGCLNLDKNVGKYWNTSEVNNMWCMFLGCKKLNKNIGKKWNVAKVKTMSNMFNACSELNKNIGKKWNTLNLSEANYMFYNCTNLVGLDLSNWNTNKLVSIHCMFTYCKSLCKIGCQNWDVSNVSGMDCVFCDTKIDELAVAKWKFKKEMSKNGLFKGF